MQNDVNMELIRHITPTGKLEGYEIHLALRVDKKVYYNQVKVTPDATIQYMDHAIMSAMSQLMAAVPRG